MTLTTIAFQDIKDHLVWWFLVPLYGVVGGVLFYTATYPEVYASMVGINLLLLVAFCAVLYLVLTFLLKKVPFKQAIGLADVLVWIALAISFPSITFIVLLAISNIFSLVLHKVIGSQEKEVPYAGYTAVFLLGIYGAHWLGFYQNLYVI